MSGERLRKRKRIWYATVYDRSGKAIERSTKCTDRKAAEAVAREWEREAADPLGAAVAKATLNDALEDLVRARMSEAKAGQRSDQTVVFYVQKAGVILRDFARHDARNLNREDARLFLLKDIDATVVDAYIDYRREEAADTSIHKELLVIRAALMLAKRRGRWRGDVDAIIPPGFGPSYKPRTRFLTPEELQKLLPMLPRGRAAIVAFIIATSAEWATVDRVLRADVSDDRQTCRLRGSKNARRDRVVPIVTVEQSSLLHYALEWADGDGEKLFQTWSNVRRDLRAACKTCGIEPVSPNDLRRTFATWLRLQGVPPNLIAPMMGHADSRMVERVYGQLSTTALRDLVERAVYGTTDPITTAGHLPETATQSMDALDSVDTVVATTEQKTPPEAGSHALGDIKLVPRDGIEPPTRGFSILCSTD
jgi:integrase